MVTFIDGNDKPTLTPAGVEVKYKSAGRARTAVVRVTTRESAESTTVAVEYDIERGTARFCGFREPASIRRQHFRCLPATTRQLRSVDCIDRVERPEKTFGDAIMEGHQFLSDES